METQARGRVSNFVAALVATLYGFWLLYAAGWQALLLAALIYLPGVILYVWAKREKGDQSLFRPYEWIIFAVLVIAAIAAICNIVNGTISVG